MRPIKLKTYRDRRAVATVLLLAGGLLTVSSCGGSDDAEVEVDTDSTLAALMADGPLPITMQAGPPTLDLPPRFCGFDGGGMLPPPDPAPPGSSGPLTMVAPPPMPAPPPGSGSASGTGGSSSGPLADPGMGGSPGEGGSGGGSGASCESVPIGHWTFDDCSTDRTDLGDRSFQGHSAFRNVALACVSGQEGQAASFAASGDIVYAPDQPDFDLSQGATVAAWVKPNTIQGVATLFRKRDDANSAMTLVIKDKKFQFVVKLASGKLFTVKTPATANEWTHIAATYDGEHLRLYKNGIEASKTKAQGEIANGVGPLLMGNDIQDRRFKGLMDNAWFNTLAAPAETIMQLTCVHAPPTATVSPVVGPTVPAGTSVEYQLAITSHDSASCAPASLFAFVNLPSELTSDNSFIQTPPLAGGETSVSSVNIASGDEVEPGTYPVDFQVFDSNFNTSINLSATYSAAEPTGCFVSSSRELMIRDLSVVDDPIRTTFSAPTSDARRGAWTFGGLMRQMAPTAAAAPAMAEQLFQTWLSDQTVNGFSVPARPLMQDLVLNSWPRMANGELDLEQAPLRLLAIVNRLDLRDLSAGKAGEGRFVFGVLDPSGFPTEFTVILEYRLPARTTADVTAWAERWHNLRALPFPSEAYNVALQDVTTRFAGRGAEPGRPNGSALGQLRTNEIALSFQWELREFHLSATTGLLAQAPVDRTPDTGFMFDSPLVADFVNQNESSILAETHTVPMSFQGSPFQGGSSFNNLSGWFSFGISNNEARHKFSVNTCNGCHSSQETGTDFLQIFPRSPGEVSRLSGFLTGTTVKDPGTGEERAFNDLRRRRLDLTAIVCPSTAPTGAAPSAAAPSAGAARSAFLSKGVDRSH